MFTIGMPRFKYSPVIVILYPPKTFPFLGATFLITGVLSFLNYNKLANVLVFNPSSNIKFVKYDEIAIVPA